MGTQTTATCGHTPSQWAHKQQQHVDIRHHNGHTNNSNMWTYAITMDINNTHYHRQNQHNYKQPNSQHIHEWFD